MPEVARLRENLLHDMTVQVGEAEVASFVFKDEFFVLDAKEVELYEKMIAGVKAKKISQKKMIVGRACVGPIRREIGGETSVIETTRGMGYRFRSCESQ